MSCKGKLIHILKIILYYKILSFHIFFSIGWFFLDGVRVLVSGFSLKDLAGRKGCNPVFVSHIEHSLTVPEPRIWGLHARLTPGEGQSHTEARLEHQAVGHFPARPFLADTQAGGSGGLRDALRGQAWVRSARGRGTPHQNVRITLY